MNNSDRRTKNPHLHISFNNVLITNATSNNTSLDKSTGLRQIMYLWTCCLTVPIPKLKGRVKIRYLQTRKFPLHFGNLLDLVSRSNLNLNTLLIQTGFALAEVPWILLFSYLSMPYSVSCFTFLIFNILHSVYHHAFFGTLLDFITACVQL